MGGFVHPGIHNQYGISGIPLRIIETYKKPVYLSGELYLFFALKMCVDKYHTVKYHFDI